MTATDLAFADWVARARAVPVADVIATRGIVLKRAGTELAGPCPVCGGNKRFSVAPRKNLWICRAAGRGGDAIALVQYLDGANFLAACETLTGEAPPRGEGTRASAEVLAQREAERLARQAAQEAGAQIFRERERRALYATWRRSLRPAGTPVEAYLALRGLVLPPGTALRYLPDAPYFHGETEDEMGRPLRSIIHRGPAMVAAITDASGHFAALHTTWIDPSRPKGKAVLRDPETGDLLPTRKVRGHKQGGRILLVPAAVDAPACGVAGEGIETVLSVWQTMMQAGGDLSRIEFSAAVDLGNLAGKALERVRHPTLTATDKAGRTRVQRVPGPDPDFASEAMPVPDSIARLILLGDGDSDPFTTRMAMARAERRHAREGREVVTRWAPDGQDFNDILMGHAARDGRAA